MCFFYSIPKQPKEIANRYQKQLSLFDEEEMSGQYLIKGFDHTTDHFIITDDKEIRKAKWGLIPFWSSKEHAERIRSQNSNVNAKGETVFTLSSFRVSAKQKRCLIPVSGWFEYHYEKKKVKDIYYIYVKDIEIFSFAGVYDNWVDKETGEVFTTYAIITEQPNNLMRFIHNGGKNPFRMPVILNKEGEENWLNKKSDTDYLRSLLKPYPDELMDAYPIDKTSDEFRKASPFDETVKEKKDQK